jgi:methyltransferase family protein
MEVSSVERPIVFARMAQWRIRGLERERINLRAQYVLKRIASRFGWHVVRAGYYSPIVDDRELPASVFSRRAPMPGVELDLAVQLELLEGKLAPYLAEWTPPLGPPGDELGFFLDNPFYGPLDANILYALVRSLKPRRLLELGSGFSTLAIRHAAAANARDGAELDHTVVDPFPAGLLRGLGGFTRVEVPAAELDIAVFAALQPGDILFVDTTHVVKAGGEVNYLVLEVLPALAAGVVIHFHDIFRPFEYPRILFDRYNVHWQEQYLLQAFLAFNPEFRVLCANHALMRLHPDRMAALVPGLRPEMVPSGFWFEKLA